MKEAEIEHLTDNATEILDVANKMSREEAMNALGAAVVKTATEAWPPEERFLLMVGWCHMICSSVAIMANMRPNQDPETPHGVRPN